MSLQDLVITSATNGVVAQIVRGLLLDEFPFRSLRKVGNLFPFGGRKFGIANSSSRAPKITRKSLQIQEIVVENTCYYSTG